MTTLPPLALLRRTATRPSGRRRSRPLLESLEGRQLLTGTADQIFAQLQQFQMQEQVFASVHGTVDVGTFNARTGFFTGLGGSVWVSDSGGDPNLGPVLKPRPPHIEEGPPGHTYTGSANVGLTFEVVNARQGSFSVTVNGTTVSAAPGQNAVSIEVGTATHVDYTVRSGYKSYSGSFEIVRPAYIGVSTIPVIPLAVIYDAPQDSAGKNVNQFTQTSSRSTTVSVEYSKDSSTTTPGDIPGGYGPLVTAENVVNGASKVLSNTPGVPDDVKKAAGSVGSLFSALLGTSEATHTDQQTGATATSRGMSYTVSETITPTTHLGPGEGDLIEFISDVKLVTVGWQGQATTAKLFDHGIQVVSVHFLKQRLAGLGSSDAPDPMTGLDRTTIQALLALDPLASGGPNAPLDGSRYQHLTDLSVNGSRIQGPISVTHTASQVDTSTHTVVNTLTDKSGWLSFLGIGVTDDRSTKVTVTNKNSDAIASSQTVTASFDLNAGAGEYYNVQIFYDTVFGSILLRKTSLPGGGAVRGGSGTQSAGLTQPKGFAAISPGVTSVATFTTSQESRAPGHAESAAARPSTVPRNVLLDPAGLRAIPRSKLVLQDVD